MSRKFDATSTTDDVLEGIDLHGKRVFITGVSAALGVETARALAARGANVVGAVRNVAKAVQATAGVREAAAAAVSSWSTSTSLPSPACALPPMSCLRRGGGSTS